MNQRLRILSAFGASALVFLLAGGPAAAQTVSNPTANPYPVQNLPANQQADAPYGNALASFEVDVTGFPANTLIFAEECDGESSSAPGWTPTLDCDLGSATAGVRTNSSGAATFPIANPNTGFFPFYGTSPQSLFQCVENGNTTATAPPPVWGTTPTTDCQLRVSTNNSNGTVPQVMISLSTPAPAAVTPETRYVVLLPFGALLLIGGAYVVARKRNRPAVDAVS